MFLFEVLVLPVSIVIYSSGVQLFVLVLLLLGFLNHGFDFCIVLLVVLEILNHCLLWRQLWLVDSSDRGVQLLYLNLGNELERASLCWVDELWPNLYGGTLRGEKCQVKHFFTEDFYVGFWTSLSNDPHETTLRLNELLIAVVLHGLRLFEGDINSDMPCLVVQTVKLDV